MLESAILLVMKFCALCIGLAFAVVLIVFLVNILCAAVAALRSAKWAGPSDDRRTPLQLFVDRIWWA